MNASARKTELLLAERARHVPRGVATAHPVAIERALGTEVWDVDGKRYLDFVGGIGVLNVGHNHPRVVEAVSRQLQKVSHAAFQVAAYEPYIDLAARLNTLIGGDDHYKSIFLTTGAEAVENAIKIARGYTNRPGVIAFRGAFHGRTLLGVTLTGFSQPYKQNFGPFPTDIYHAAYPDLYRGITTDKALASLEEVFATEIAPDRVAAIIIEPVQGDGGFLPAPDDFLVALREITKRHGIVFICDEIQTGFGRTGDLFGFQRSGIKPDLVTVAKSLAGGLPLSGVVGRAEIMDAPTPGGLGGTYGGNALACAAALGVLDAFEKERLLERGAAGGARLRAGLEALQRRYSDRIGEVRGRGSMLAVEIVADAASKRHDADFAQVVIDKAREEGLLIIKCGVHRNVIRFLAPLVTTDAQIDEAVAAFSKAFALAAG
ncbi:4-aminobutyrate aminotransferase GabT [Hyphomicrobiales bacterium]|nr:4-aminobutyrate aminotransferase GabT [Hyphomicrobiales bacterium]CAH1674807.1 4-aminobutyrate aminotransferase GabT [Hyphomicrobiales bacterium]